MTWTPLTHVVTSDGSAIAYRVVGEDARPAVFLGPPWQASREHAPDDTDQWIDALTMQYRVIIADFPVGIGRSRAGRHTQVDADTLTRHCEAIADAARVSRFAWLGYSFGAALGTQLALRSPRLSALAVGGFPPTPAPIQPMIKALQTMSRASHLNINHAAASGALSFYRSISAWNGETKTPIARLAYMGAEDEAETLPLGLRVPLADQLREAEPRLRRSGWEIAWLPGAAHAQAMRAEHALPIVKSFLARALRNIPGDTDNV